LRYGNVPMPGHHCFHPFIWGHHCFRAFFDFGGAMICWEFFRNSFGILSFFRNSFGAPSLAIPFLHFIPQFHCVFTVKHSASPSHRTSRPFSRPGRYIASPGGGGGGCHLIWQSVQGHWEDLDRRNLQDCNRRRPDARGGGAGLDFLLRPAGLRLPRPVGGADVLDGERGERGIW